MTDADVEQLPAAVTAHRAAPRNPFVVTLVVLDVALATLGGSLFLAATAIASSGRPDDAAGQLAAAAWCIDAAGIITLLLLAVAAVRWRPPGE
ncbi:MAG: hypothetical protein ACTHJL_04950 [Amnibacterium sp.]